MAWEAIDLRTHRGLPVSNAEREIILDAAEQAIFLNDEDPQVVMRAAAKVGRRVDVIGNLRAYVNRTIFRAVRKSVMAQGKKDALFTAVNPSELASSADVDRIENRILVRELLEVLGPQDREIMLRRISGDTFPEIDKALHLTPRTAEFRYRACKDALRKVLSDKLDNRP